MGTLACAGALAVLLLAALALFGLILGQGFLTFWPRPLEQWKLADGRTFLVEPNGAAANGDLRARIGNRELNGMNDFIQVAPGELVSETVPEDAFWVERAEYGPFHGRLTRVELPDGVHGGEALLPRFLEEAPDLRDRIAAAGEELGRAAGRETQDLPEIETLRKKISSLQERLGGYRLVAATADGREVGLPGATVLRVRFPNRLSFLERTETWLGGAWRFLTEAPREANTEGGVWPALVGTCLMVILMSILVVPFGVLAAVYLNEYARENWFVRFVRISVNNLAGVPSIVYGVFGLGFFVYGIGGGLDHLFLDPGDAPRFGRGGLLWASLTMALLTVPVVIAATEEGLAAVPRERREGALALGATRWEMVWKVILPGARPGILTGVILAVSRAAGEVAPLMLTGVVGNAINPVAELHPPFLHLDRPFMHLGFHIYSVGFQAPNVESAVPLVYATCALLLLLVLFLNLLAIRMRIRIRRSLQGR
ncbi:MAG: phosphate ABC transporter permease PstA [Planctomycetota bacterium]